MNTIKQAFLDDIKKNYFNKTISHEKAFYELKVILGSWFKASQAFQTLWMERP